MIDFAKEVEFKVGDTVSVDSQNQLQGVIETIRVIANAKLVQEYHGAPNRVVLTIQLKNGIINKRGADITPLVVNR